VHAYGRKYLPCRAARQGEGAIVRKSIGTTTRAVGARFTPKNAAAASPTANCATSTPGTDVPCQPGNWRAFPGWRLAIHCLWPVSDSAPDLLWRIIFTLRPEEAPPMNKPVPPTILRTHAQQP
jgi:hypothetical protein